MNKKNCTADQWAVYLAKKAQQRKARKVARTPEQELAFKENEKLRRKKAKRKADYTFAEWENIKAKARVSDAKQRAKSQRRQYMQSYMSVYTKTPEYRISDNARYDAVRREKHLSRMRKRVYGANETLVADLMEIQKAACAVCLRVFNRNVRELKDCLDHCHDTKQVRGLLCLACNLAEGYIKQTGLEPVDFAKRLAEYLVNPPTKIAELV